MVDPADPNDPPKKYTGNPQTPGTRRLTKRELEEVEKERKKNEDPGNKDMYNSLLEQFKPRTPKQG